MASTERRSHRQLDATRRAKESAALSRLDQLTARERREVREAQQAAAARSAAGSGRRPASDARKREKLTVLEASISHIERLHALVDRLIEAGDSKDRRMQELTHHLRSVATRCAQMEERTANSAAVADLATHPYSHSPISLLSAPAADYVSYLDSHHALYSSIFLHSGLVMMLMDLDTAVIIDANSRFVEQTGFVREDVVGRRVNGKEDRTRTVRARQRSTT